MKKMLLFLPAVLLALFISGCGDPDAELKSKVPDSADALCLVDGNYIVQTKLYNDHKQDVLKELKEENLPEDIFQCRLLIFGSVKEEGGGFVLQSKNGQVRKIFDLLLGKSKKDGDIKDLKETTVGKEIHVTGTIEGKSVIAVLYNDNLLLAGVNKIDLAFYKSVKGNPLFGKLQWKKSILSAAVKVELPKQGSAKETVDTAVQMLPALQKLSFVSLNLPFAEKDPEVDFQMIFSDDSAAGEMLAAFNMGLGFVAQEAPELNTALSRKTEKNALLISFKIDEMDKAVKAVQARKEQKERAREAKRKAKKAKAKKQLSAKPAPAPAQPKAAEPAPVKAAPAEAPKAAAPAQPKAAEPAPAK